EADDEQDTLAAAYRPGAASEPAAVRAKVERPSPKEVPSREDEIAASALGKARMHAEADADAVERSAPFAASVAAAKGLVGRMRRSPSTPREGAEPAEPLSGDDLPPAPDSSAPNDLRSYLRRRAELNARGAERPRLRQGEESVPRHNAG